MTPFTERFVQPLETFDRKHAMPERPFIFAAALNMLIAVACGAFGAHALKQILSAEMLAIWQTAVQYQMVHALGQIGRASCRERVCVPV